MTTETEIANRALQIIGAKRIAAYGETTSKEGREISAAWDRIRQSELRKYPWNFAITRASIAASVSAPEWGFDQCFEKPAGCLRIIEVNGSREASDYQVESLSNGTQVIVCDFSAPLEVRYIRDVTNVGEWDAIFCEAFAARLAQALAPTIADSTTKTQMGAAEYKDAISEARQCDAIENPPEDRYEDTWNEARL